MEENNIGMKGILLWAMKEFPYLEIWTKILYKKLKEKHPKLQIRTRKAGKKIDPSISRDEVKALLQKLGIGRGDFLIVHSSMDGLRNADVSAVEWIKLLQEIVGEEGTVAFAAFPFFGERDRMIEGGREIRIYEPAKKKVSTGILPSVFCRMPQVVRSKCPNNTLAAWGKEAKAMMEHNLESDLAHGKNSSWFYAVQHHAKILYLGIPVTEADTVVHVVEDCLDEEWPIADWYKQSEYFIIEEGEKIRKTMRLRNGNWHRYFTSQYSGKLLDKYGFRKRADTDEIVIELIPDAKAYVEYLTEEAKKGKILYRIPKKYWRN